MTVAKGSKSGSAWPLRALAAELANDEGPLADDDVRHLAVVGVVAMMTSAGDLWPAWLKVLDRMGVQEQWPRLQRIVDKGLDRIQSARDADHAAWLEHRAERKVIS